MLVSWMLVREQDWNQRYSGQISRQDVAVANITRVRFSSWMPVQSGLHTFSNLILMESNP